MISEEDSVTARRYHMIPPQQGSVTAIQRSKSTAVKCSGGPELDIAGMDGSRRCTATQLASRVTAGPNFLGAGRPPPIMSPLGSVPAIS